jgi:hypothetical protein
MSRDAGGPMFDLFTFRKGGTAGHTETGGFLNMTVDVGIGSLKRRIEAELRDRTGGDVTLASVPITRGSVRLVALGEDSKAVSDVGAAERTPEGQPLVAPGPRFIENILGASTPSLDGDNRAIFSLSLSEDGANFFLGVLREAVNARPVGVIYDLEYVGLLPAYDLEITIDFKSSYDYMRSRFTLGTLFFKAEVDNIVEALKREQHIKIKEVARTLELSDPQAVQARQQHIDQVVKDLATGALFQPALVPGEPRVRDGLVSAAEPTGGTTTNPTTNAVLSAAAQGPSPAVATGMGQAYQHSLGSSTAGSTTTGGTAGTGAGTSGGPGAGTPSQTPTTATDVWNQLGRPQAAYGLRTISQTEERTVTYSLTQVTAQKRTVAPQGFVQFLAGPSELTSHVHEIDLNDPFFERVNINVNAADVDFATQGVSQLTVELRYGTRPDGTGPKDTAQAILRAATDSLDVTFFADSKQTLSYEYRLIVDYRTDFGLGVKEPRVEGPWTSTEARSLAVHPRNLGLVLPLTVEMAPGVGQDVVEIQAVVRYQRPDKNIDESALLHLNAQARSRSVPVRLVAEGDQVEVTPRVFYTDGTQEQVSPIRVPDPDRGQATSDVVLALPRADYLSGDIIMLDPLAELKSVIVDTEVRQHDSLVKADSTELTGAGSRKTWSVRLTDHATPPVLRYKERRVFQDGGLEAGNWIVAPSTNLVVGIPAEGVGSVTVHYIGPAPSQLALSAIELDMEYNDPSGDNRFHQTTSLLIDDTPTSWTQEWKFRLVHREQRAYSWTLTLLKADGTSTSTTPSADQRPQLIVRAPHA